MKKRTVLAGAALAAVLLPTAYAVDPPVVFVEMGTMNSGPMWKYLDEGVDPGFTWTYLDYDDSSWEMGRGELGFNEGDETTLISRGASPFPTSFYFRLKFNVTQSQLNALEGNDFFYQLIFNLVRDDGAIVYLNEIEMFRSNVGEEQDGEPDTVALGAVGGQGEKLVNEIIVNGDGILMPGENVLAVSVHQSSAGSSDISFNMGMSAIKVAPTFGVYRPPQGINFDQDPPGGLDFKPDPFGGQTDLGWDIKFSGGGPTAFGITDIDPISFSPFPEGFLEGKAFYVNNGTATLVTQTIEGPGEPKDSELRYRVDLRNHKNVKVAFDVRCDDTGGPQFGYPFGNGFETSDKITYRHVTSPTGSEFTKTDGLLTPSGPLPGGGSGGLNFETVELIKENDTKTGLVPTDGSLGTSWHEIGFDDAGWVSFTKGVGYDSAATYIPFIGFNTSTLMRSKNASCYMRIPFIVDDKDGLNTLTLYARDDDGYVAYINGERVHSVNGPASPVWNSTATGNNPDGGAVGLKGNDISQHLDKLVNGPNILAVHCLNQSTSSSDFLVSVELEGTLPNQAPRNDPPQSLNDINFGVEGPFYRYVLDVDDNVNSYTFEFEIRNNEGNETVYFDNWIITGDPQSIDSYDSWTVLRDPPLEEGESAEPLADPDGDGIVNWLEFAFDGDPQVASQTTPAGAPLLPLMSIVEENGNFYYELSWRQRDASSFGSLDFPYGGYALQGIQYVPQFSNDGVFWDDGRFGYQGDLIGDPIDGGDGTLTLRMRYKNPILQPGDPEPFFGRILVTKAVPIIEDPF